MEQKERRNNLRSISKMQNFATNQGMRNVIDKVDSEIAFRPSLQRIV